MENAIIDDNEQSRIQEKQGGPGMPPRRVTGRPIDDTDRNTDKVINPAHRNPAHTLKALWAHEDGRNQVIACKSNRH